MLRLLNQIRAILYPAEKYRLIFISILVFFSDLLELCGLGLIMPVIALFLNPELFEQNTYLVYIRNFTGSLSNNSLMILLCMVCALFFVAKNILLYLIALLQTRFAYTLSARLGSELLKRYIEGDYRFHLKGTTGGMVEKLQQTRNVIPHFISALMMLTSEAALVLLILLSVFILAPYSALGIAVSGTIFSVPLLLFMKKMVQHLAALTFERAVKLNSFILFTANALKEIKLANRSKPFVREGHKLEYEAIEMPRLQFIYGQIPRFAIEAGVVFLGMGTIVVLLLCGIAPTSIALQISFIGLALMRMTPSVARIQYNWVLIRGYQFFFDKIYKDLQAIRLEAPPSEPPITFEHEIRVENLSFGYDKDSPVLQNVSLTIPKNTSLAFSGPTGCGKTTLGDLITGLFPPDSGRVLVDGRDIRGNLESWRALIGYVPQNISLMNGTIAENIAIGIPTDQIDRARIAACLKIAQAEDFVLSQTNGIDHVLTENGRNLSGGQRQRLAIARALYPNPAFLIFDEATSALDNATETAFVEALSSLRGKYTMLVIAHRQTSVDHCDAVFRFPAPAKAETKTEIAGMRS